MRVLHVDTGREWRGGQTQLLHLVRSSEDVVVLPPDAPLRPALEAAGVDVRCIAMRGPIWGSRSLRRLIADARPDLVAAHTSQAHAQALWANPHKPVLVHRRNDFIPRPLSRLKYRAADGYVAVSHAVARVLHATGVPQDKTCVVLDGVDLAQFTQVQPDPIGVRQELGLQRDARLILAVGALVAHKGHRHLLDALTTLPEWHVVILGEGPLRHRLLTQATQLGLGARVHLPGWRRDVPRWLVSVDVFAHPSVEEGMGSAVAEALVAGAIVVSTNAGGLPEVVDGSGTVVQAACPHALARGIRSAAGSARHDIEAARTRFAMERMAQQTRVAYHHLCR